MSELLTLERRDAVEVVGLNRPDQRNAISNALIGALHEYFSDVPHAVRVVVLHGHGDSFCAGLDLKELLSTRPDPGAPLDVRAQFTRSKTWHRTFDLIQFGDVPVISVLKGAVMGGGLELASATHVRVAERSTTYMLPEGQRGIFLGGSGSVRIPRLIGAARVIDMMLTGRTHGAEDGLALGFNQYVVDDGQGIDKAMQLARQIASNAPAGNYAIINGIQRISDMALAEGMFAELMVSRVASSGSNSSERISGFFESRKAAKQRTP